MIDVFASGVFKTGNIPPEAGKVWLMEEDKIILRYNSETVLSIDKKFVDFVNRLKESPDELYPPPREMVMLLVKIEYVSTSQRNIFGDVFDDFKFCCFDFERMHKRHVKFCVNWTQNERYNEFFNKYINFKNAWIH